VNHVCVLQAKGEAKVPHDYGSYYVYIPRPLGNLMLKNCVQRIRRWTESISTLIKVNTFGARYVMLVLWEFNIVLNYHWLTNSFDNCRNKT
jgi:hypothetical protein